jgi:2-acylglycerol O-acyltransferase 2
METMSQLPEEPKAQDGPKEESFVDVSKNTQSNGDEKDHQNGTPTPPPEESSEKATDAQPSSETAADTSFAEVVREGLNGEEQTEEQDYETTRSDESYPELDDMAIDEVPRSRARRHEPYQKIRWAPFHVPAKRRLQTLAVLAHCLCIGVTVSLFFACCANPLMWPLLLIYLMHVLNSKAHSDGSLRYRSEWFRSSYIWDLFAGYFPAKLHKTNDLPSTRKYIFGYHPHGIISHGAWAAFATEALGFAEKFPGITNSLLTLESNFRIPFYREYIMSMGMRSVSRESIVNILTRGGQNGEGMGRAVTIVIGGARESLEAQPGTLHLILKDRKGFVKIAVRTGADLVPVVAFGENDLYDQLQPQEHPLVHKVQMFILKVWKFTVPFLHGRGVFNYDVGMMPYRHPLNVVVGAPIKVRQSSHVDDAEIDRLHALYVAEVQKLWDQYKDKFAADRTEELQIVH